MTDLHCYIRVSYAKRINGLNNSFWVFADLAVRGQKEAEEINILFDFPSKKEESAKALHYYLDAPTSMSILATLKICGIRLEYLEFCEGKGDVHCMAPMVPVLS